MTLIPVLPDASATVRGAVSISTQTFAGAKTFSSAPTFSTITLGSVLFAGTGGLVSEDNATLFWDNTNKRLGVGMTAPAFPLQVRGSAADTRARIENNTAFSALNFASLDLTCNSSTQLRSAVFIKGNFTDTTDATRTGKLDFLVCSSGSLASRMDITGNAITTSSPVGIGISPTANRLHVSHLTVASGPSAWLAFTQTTANAGDTTDTGLLIQQTLSLSSATNELVLRGIQLKVTNSMTGGGLLSNARCFDLETNTSASTTTTALDALYISAGTSSGTVTGGRGIYIESVQGTSRAGVVIAPLTGGTNNTSLLLGTGSIQSGNWGIYNNSTNNSYFAGPLLLNTTTALTVTGMIQLKRTNSVDGSARSFISLSHELDGTALLGYPNIYAGTNFKSTTIADPFSVGVVGLQQTIAYGAQSGPAVRSVGSVLGVHSTIYVYNSGDYENEHSPYYGAVRYDSNSNAFGNTTPGRAWMCDFSIHSAINQQQGALAGVHMFINNHYDGPPRDTPSGAIWVVTKPGVGGDTDAYHIAARSFPIGVGLGVVGASQSDHSRGYEVGVQIGGIGSNWQVDNSRVGTGLDVFDYDNAGIRLQPRFSGVIQTYLVTGGSGYTTVPTVTLTAAPSGGTTATAAAELTATTVASVTITTAGSAFTSVPTVTFAAPTPSGTTATGTVVMGVGQLILTAGGSGYTNGTGYALGVTGGGGSSFAGTFDVVAGVVGNLVITVAGTGYTSQPTLSFPGAGSGTGAAATAYLKVVSITVTGAGSGYTLQPTLTFAGGGGGGAVASAVFASTSVAYIRVTAAGRKYVATPAITISGGGGTGAVAVCTIWQMGVVTDALISSPGSGYASSSPPAVTFAEASGQGTGCTLTIVTGSGIITSATVNAAGSAYPLNTIVYLLVSGGGANAVVSVPTSPTGTVSGTVTVLYGGTGYSNGTSATTNWRVANGLAVVDGTGKCTGVQIIDFGSGYSSSPAPTVAAPNVTTATAAVAAIASGIVTSATVTGNGSGYWTGAATTVDDTGTGGSGLILQPRIQYGKLIIEQVLSGGAGYFRTGDSGSAGTVTLTTSAGAITSAVVSAAGSGYPVSIAIRLGPVGGNNNGVIQITTNSSGQLAGAVTVVSAGTGYSNATVATINVPRLSVVAPPAGSTATVGTVTLSGYGIQVDSQAGPSLFGSTTTMADLLSALPSELTRPAASMTVPANYTAWFYSLPYRINSGVIITVAAGALLRITP